MPSWAPVGFLVDQGYRGKSAPLEGLARDAGCVSRGDAALNEPENHWSSQLDCALGSTQPLQQQSTPSQTCFACFSSQLAHSSPKLAQYCSSISITSAHAHVHGYPRRPGSRLVCSRKQALAGNRCCEAQQSHHHVSPSHERAAAACFIYLWTSSASMGYEQMAGGRWNCGTWSVKSAPVSALAAMAAPPCPWAFQRCASKTNTRAAYASP